MTAALAWWTTSAILQETGGEAAVPLDDAFIHFQYARAFAELKPFVYTPGGEPTPGATSVLWPLVLAAFHALGFGGMTLIPVAWGLGWAFLALLAIETYRTALGLTERDVALATGALVPAFGAFLWFAGSGMEVLPFAWVLLRTARRSAEWVETSGEVRAGAATTVPFWELCALAIAAPLLRPEGILGTVVVAGALLRRPPRRRALSMLPALGFVAPGLLYAACTGRLVTTTAHAKWLPLNPYFQGRALADAILENVHLLVGTLLDGRAWSALFLPAGSRVIGWLALAAIAVSSWRRRRIARGIAVLCVALGMLLPTTYETFLVNRLRYLWPFAPAWLIGLGALADLAGEGARRLHHDLAPVRLLVAGAWLGLLASRAPASVEDLARSADAVRRQQVSLALWARDTLPPGSVVGVNDAGALAYLGGHATFDIVGLTTPEEARYWTAGPGSRFEHYERLGADQLPTHFIVYPEWLGIDSILGQRLTERSVAATILGGRTKAAYRARYDVLGSAARPRDPPAGRDLVDALDVADLDSEEGHGYELFRATQRTNVVVAYDDRADGGRSERSRDRFQLELAGGGTFVARVGTRRAGQLSVRVAGRTTATVPVSGVPWEEVRVRISEEIPSGRHTVEVAAAPPATFTSMHYWSYR